MFLGGGPASSARPAYPTDQNEGLLEGFGGDAGEASAEGVGEGDGEAGEASAEACSLASSTIFAARFSALATISVT